MEKSTILVVEDEKYLSDLLASILRLEGYNIIQSKDGLEALASYNQFHDSIGIVLLDIGLPKLGGSEVFAKLKQIDPEIKVIFITGYIEEQLYYELMNAGVRKIIHKPFTAKDISNSVREAL